MSGTDLHLFLPGLGYHCIVCRQGESHYLHVSSDSEKAAVSLLGPEPRDPRSMPCPTCAAAADRPCRSAAGSATHPHVARRRACDSARKRWRETRLRLREQASGDRRG